MDGMSRVMHKLAERVHPLYPVTIYYAFRQVETDNEAGTVSTGWETFLAQSSKPVSRLAALGQCGLS